MLNAFADINSLAKIQGLPITKPARYHNTPLPPAFTQEDESTHDRASPRLHLVAPRVQGGLQETTTTFSPFASLSSLTNRVHLGRVTVTRLPVTRASYAYGPQPRNRDFSLVNFRSPFLGDFAISQRDCEPPRVTALRCDDIESRLMDI